MRKTAFLKICGTTILALAVLLRAWDPAQAADPEITLAADREVVGMGEHLTLEARVTGSAGTPEIEGMESFEVLSQSTGEQISIVNMTITSSKTYTYILRPLAPSGTVRLKATVEAGGKRLSSNVLEVQLVQSTGKRQAPQPQRRPGGFFGGEGDPFGFFDSRRFREDDFIVQAMASKTEAYTGEEIVYTLTFYRAVNLWSKPEFHMPDMEGFWSEQLPDDEKIKSSRQSIGGREYIATEVNAVIYPISEGEAEIAPGGVTFQSDPFSQVARLDSAPVPIKVLPLPKEGKPGSFSGLVGKFSMAAGAGELSAQTGKPLKIEVTVSGRGNLQSIPEPGSPEFSDVEKYSPEVTDDFRRMASGSEGSRKFTYVLIPQKPGLLEVGPFTLNYFDPESGEYREIKSAPFSIEVAGEIKTEESAAPFANRREMEKLASDIRFIMPDSDGLPSSWKPYFKNPLFYIYPILLLTVLGVCRLYAKRMERLYGDKGNARKTMAMKMAVKRLASAKAIMSEDRWNEFHAEVDHAFRNFLADKWGVPPSSITPDFAKERLCRLNGEFAERCEQVMRECDGIRFSPVKSDMKKMRDLFDRVGRLISEMEGKI